MTNILSLIEKFLTQPIPMQLSEKEKTFSQFFFAFLICILNFQHFPKKDDPRS